MITSRLIILVLFLSSCNTCLNPSEVPFLASSDTGDVGLDVADPFDSGDPDLPGITPDQDQCEEVDWCSRAARTCGVFAPADPCAPSSVDCGTCGDTAFCSEGACECLDGYLPGEDGCDDIDECADQTDDCEDDMFCINEPGTFRCSDCPAGQERGDDGRCVDIDECATNTDDCDPLVSCTNLDPGFECGPCPSGYDDPDSNGTLCTDIDECADGADNCDANATCTNAPGSFSCACNSGYEGDGVSCTATVVPLVVSVTTIEQQLAENTERAAVPLPVGPVPTQLVPFVTARIDGSSEPEDGFVTVSVDVGANELAFERPDDDGDLTVVVSLVEFHSSVTVLAGKFTTGSASQTIPIANTNPSESFLVFTNTLSVNEPREAGLVMGELTNNSQVRFSRTSNDGSVEGYFYVVSSPELSVSRETVNVGSMFTCGTTNLPAIDPAQTIALYSFEGGGLSGGSAGSLSANCRLRTNDIQCCRGSTNFLSSMTAEVQLVDITGAAVHRGETTLMALSNQETLTTSVDATYATALSGPSGLAGGAIVEGMTGNDDLAQVTATVENNGSLIELRRGDSAALDTDAWWQVIEWPH